MSFSFEEHPHRRLNILTGEWVLVSPHRTKRPWQGKVENLPVDNRPAYDEKCYLCPGNTRSDGSINPPYKGPYAFTNDFSALLQDTPSGKLEDGLLQASSEKGICRVICFSPRHDLTLPQMEEDDIVKVIDLWQDEFSALSKNEWIKYIQIFENKGEIMGCSNPHPHGQIWAQSTVPGEPAKESIQFKQYFEKKGKSILSDYVTLEQQKQERIVCENEHFIAIVPFWAVWPFETMLISKRHVQNILEFTEEEKKAFAKILKNLTIKYDNLFETSFPYSAGMHQAPVNDGEHPEWHWHMHFYPPLLRSATVKKFMVGYEMLANPQRDITPEQAAKRLKDLSDIHYLKK
ncbi:UDP-glucose-hexose-1-phosphate uridylyltransferase; UTP-hexose-1-phosphate uridylyltransferase [Pseudopedobacter saltans DSM 12145]|uniref:Galactose-1-phosphate uridylyltransferase n=1 Tax=Pseudopedobacter saltans (strain ATCC 51119 / DSM 12145 / JCM 21818 / CCUG 39354 / LMG 10337 / NBRC 100064 / NCIMB 13643) TaxID=762903 RepID=F0S7Z1_PSESL|nr:UDP-glucose--hexose-1-phosphate uridylyltransferase [Pseudopedobacter saltans]ADY51212.1 UDP-glucose-hexose-1-phosphate uridylyltransferase; UTP-hexose-1-phosphate uridylyltransferase [Pseudopedobacter saltans DSM 12145]